MYDTQKNWKIANSYYNQGLERAHIRNLTGATDSLKKSLIFNKYHTDARNLLGLIYYEMGEVAHALVQWVISMNLQPENNRADYYLDEIQRKPGRLEAAGQDIRKYNTALQYAQNGNEDLAILQLNRVIEANSHFLKAHLLLALLYMQKGDFPRAGHCLYRILKIDKDHPKAQYYMSVVKKNTGKEEVERRKLKNAFSHRQMQDDDIIIPPTYTENTGLQMVLHIVAGLLLGAAVIFFIALPTQERRLSRLHDDKMKAELHRLSEKDLVIDQLKLEVEQAKEAQARSENDLSVYTDGDGGVLKQYETVIHILNAYRSGDMRAAVRAYITLDASLIPSESVQAIAANIQADMQANGYQVLQIMGAEAVEAGNLDEALVYFQHSLNLNPANAQVIFDMALIYKNRGETDTANELFSNIINNFPTSDLAARARQQRGY